MNYDYILWIILCLLALLLQVATDRDESGDPIDDQQLTLQSLAEEQLFAKALASEAADGGGGGRNT